MRFEAGFSRRVEADQEMEKNLLVVLQAEGSSLANMKASLQGSDYREAQRVFTRVARLLWLKGHEITERTAEMQVNAFVSKYWRLLEADAQQDLASILLNFSFNFRKVHQE